MGRSGSVSIINRCVSLRSVCIVLAVRVVTISRIMSTTTVLRCIERWIIWVKVAIVRACRVLRNRYLYNSARFAINNHIMLHFTINWRQ